jgi:hypothetical protein
MKGQGWGLIAKELVPKGAIVAIYGGEMVETEHAENFFWSKHGLHVKSVDGKWKGHSLNGVVNLQRPMKYYLDCGMVGSIINNIINHGSCWGINVNEV